MYAEIIDKGECMSTLNQYHDFPWPEPFLKKIACRDEWSKYNFYPSNGLVGKIAYNMESTIYILIINELFYVPMSKKGIQFISEKEYSERISTQLITGMDERQKKSIIIGINSQIQIKLLMQLILICLEALVYIALIDNGSPKIPLRI